MAEIKNNGQTFIIDDEILAKYKELVDMVIATESMDDDERQYWFDIMPSMTEDQIDKLYNILDTERKKLKELELKYQKEIKNLNEKHLLKWQEFQLKESKKKIAKAEAEEKDDAEDVLALLNDL